MASMEKVDIPEGVSGTVSVRRFEVTEEAAKLERLRSIIGGRGRGVPAGWYTGLFRNGGLWMSDTPDEMMDHWSVCREIERRGGRVLIMGMGIGMLVKYALSLPNVEHVDVVEIDPDVIALVGPTYAGERCTIHEADAYEVKWPVGTRWDVVWHDVWQNVCGDNAPEMTRLKRSYARRADWQGCWVEAEVRRLAREDRQWQARWA
jgi:hypothetical protein